MADDKLVPITLPAWDTLRTVGGRLGLRVFTVTQRVRRWTGERPGIGTHVDMDTVLVNTGADGITVPVRARQLSRHDIVASGGHYQAGDWRIGPMTPSYLAGLFNPAGGYVDSELDPEVLPVPVATEILWLLSGPAQPSTVCDKVGEEFTALHAYLILRATGRQEA